MSVTRLPHRFAVMLAALLLWSPIANAFEITPVTSPSGIKAWLVEDHKNPIITIQATFLGGASGDPAGKPGLVNLASGLLDEGAGELDSTAFQKALADNSISLSFNSSTDSFSGALRTLTETSEAAFRLLRLALNEPRFDAAPLERVRGQVMAGLRSRKENPNRIAGRVWWKAAFPDHPYGAPRRGTLVSLPTITSADLQGFTKRTFARDQLYIGVVGDISPARLGQVLDQVFGSLPKASGAAPVPDVNLAFSGETMIVERPVPQSVVVFGHRGILRDDPDWYTATVLFEILSGGFGSRLTEELREKRGLTYGVSTYPIPLEHAGLIVGGVSTVNDRVAESIGLIKDIWARFGAEGPTAEEVRNAKDYVNGSYALRFSNSGAIAGVLTAIQRHDLGIDYIERRSGIIEAITMSDLKRVAKRLFQADELTFAVVGKPTGLVATRPAPDPES
ncbi:MAG: pitrilysin family protein [Proteobacteria bacterium]|nr:pitrilysin family protein [Pseudomonadota bacterium]MDA1311562.1 pitrilysin family protein [Pseudomonadota bacterium]